jgi:hypothetical protein
LKYHFFWFQAVSIKFAFQFQMGNGLQTVVILGFNMARRSKVAQNSIGSPCHVDGGCFYGFKVLESDQIGETCVSALETVTTVNDL